MQPAIILSQYAAILSESEEFSHEKILHEVYLRVERKVQDDGEGMQDGIHTFLIMRKDHDNSVVAEGHRPGESSPNHSYQAL